MKVKMGFVTNSSSTSFLIYGVRLDTQNEFDKILNTLTHPDYCTDDRPINAHKIADYIGQWDNDYWVGFSPEFCPNNMTMGEWKKEVKKLFAQATDIPVSWHCEGWYDG